MTYEPVTERLDLGIEYPNYSDFPSRLVIYTPLLQARASKCAQGLLRYRASAVVCIIDSRNAGLTAKDVCPYTCASTPIVASFEEAVPLAPNALLLVASADGGPLSPDERQIVKSAIATGLDVVNALHERLSLDAEFRALAEKHAVKILDIRVPRPSWYAQADVHTLESRIVLTVGTDVSVGKMSAALELTMAATKAGESARFVPTGQTGMLIAGWGDCVDGAFVDFAPAVVERSVMRASADSELLFVEGQSAINHPIWGHGALMLMAGSCPDALVLVHSPSRKFIRGYDIVIPDIASIIRAYELIMSFVKETKVIGLILNTEGFNEAEAMQAVLDYRHDVGIPTDDIVRFGAAKFWSEISEQIQKRPVKFFQTPTT